MYVELTFVMTVVKEIRGEGVRREKKKEVNERKGFTTHSLTGYKIIRFRTTILSILHRLWLCWCVWGLTLSHWQVASKLQGDVIMNPTDTLSTHSAY